MNKYLVMVSLTALLAACGEKSEQAQVPSEVPKAAEQAQTVPAANLLPRLTRWHWLNKPKPPCKPWAAH